MEVQEAVTGGTAAETWELSKENYVPVKAGRKKSALAEVPVDPSASATKQALEERRRSVACCHLEEHPKWLLVRRPVLHLVRRDLWRDIRQYQGADPLEPWQR
jgi:hypothetical protein